MGEAPHQIQQGALAGRAGPSAPGNSRQVWLEVSPTMPILNAHTYVYTYIYIYIRTCIVRYVLNILELLARS